MFTNPKANTSHGQPLYKIGSVSSLSHFRDILGGLKILNGSHDVTTPLSGQFVLHRLGLAMISLHTKFEIPVFTHYKDMKGNTKCMNWGSLRV